MATESEARRRHRHREKGHDYNRIYNPDRSASLVQHTSNFLVPIRELGRQPPLAFPCLGGTYLLDNYSGREPTLRGKWWCVTLIQE